MSLRSSARATAVVLGVAVATLVPATLAGSATPGSQDPTAQKAVSWIKTQQQADGGFEVAGFPGFETPDAVLAIAEQAQTTSTWSVPEALAAVQAATKDGKDALDYLDAYASGETGLNKGQAAKLILVARALGLNVQAFDPAGDGEPVDLVGIIGVADPTGAYGAFNATLQVVIAHDVIDRATSTQTIDLIRDAQQENGSWNFAGDPNGLEGVDQSDPDTTGLALVALAAAGTPFNDPVVQSGVAFLAQSQLADGSWGESFGNESNPNSTALAVLGLLASGWDPSSPCWRDRVQPEARGTSYANPLAQLRALQAADGHIVSPFDSFGVNTSATSQTVQALLARWYPATRAVEFRSVLTNDVETLFAPYPPACPGDGYVLFGADGTVEAFQPWGQAHGQLAATPNRPIVGGELLPDGEGYWLFAEDGGVFNFGEATFHGSLGNRVLNQPIVGGFASPSGEGYWLVAADGGVFAFGDATFHGSTGNIRLNKAVVGGASTPSGKGYWLFAEDGGVFAFGDAKFFGSTGNIRLNKAVVGGASTPSGKGYWFFAEDGGVFAFGDATFHGSTGNIRLNKPVVGGTAYPAGGGYWLFAEDGGVFNFGAAPFKGARPKANGVFVGGAA